MVVCKYAVVCTVHTYTEWERLSSISYVLLWIICALLEFTDMKMLDILNFSNRFDGVNSNLGHSTQRRHNLWIIYDQLFIITYIFFFSRSLSTWYFHCTRIGVLNLFFKKQNALFYSARDCNQRRLFIFIPFKFRINFHKSVVTLVARLSSISVCHDKFSILSTIV